MPRPSGWRASFLEHAAEYSEPSGHRRALRSQREFLEARCLPIRKIDWIGAVRE